MKSNKCLLSLSFFLSGLSAWAYGGRAHHISTKVAELRTARQAANPGVKPRLNADGQSPTDLNLMYGINDVKALREATRTGEGVAEAKAQLKLWNDQMDAMIQQANDKAAALESDTAI